MWTEFLDENHFRQDWTILAPDERNGWRDGRWADRVVEVDIGIVRSLANPARLAEIQSNTEHLHEVREALRTRGFDEPVTLVVDAVGKIALKDGHHRLLCSLDLGLTIIPARIIRSDRIRSHGLLVIDVIHGLLHIADDNRYTRT